ncbi:MAG: hypothetical protein ACTSQD_07530 [Promethearchaeota archaeon]|jgi:hypothetical protein
MERRKFFDKLLDNINGGVFGIISVGIILIGEFLVIFFNPDYIIFEDMVSALGAVRYGIIFSLSLLFSGIIIIPFYIHLSRIVIEENTNETLRKFAIISSMISCITYSLLGVFPSFENIYIIFYIHGVLALISISSGFCYLISFNILIKRSRNFKKIQAYYGFFVAGLYMLFIVTWLPNIEWFLNIAIVMWVIIISVSILKKKSNSLH